MSQPAEAPTTLPTPAETPGHLGSDLSADLLTFVAVLLAGSFGTALFFRDIVPLTLGPFVGLVAALGCRRWLAAGLVGAISPILIFFGARFASVPAWKPGLFWLQGAIETSGIAIVIGIVVFLAIANSERLRPLISALAVFVLVGTMWSSGLKLATTQSEQGWVPTQLMTSPVNFNAHMSDEQLYIAYISGVRQGHGYYATVLSVLERANEVRGPDGSVNVRSPLSYRMPTLYLLLSALPYNGGVFVMVMLAACTFGVVCAYLLGRQFVTNALALAGAAFVASVFSGLASPSMLDAESWTGIFGLAAVLFMVLSYRRQSRAWGLQLAAVGFAVLGALFRELGVAFLLLGLAAALADRRDVGRRYWIAWVGGLIVTFGALAAHWSIAAAAYRGAPASGPDRFSWFHPDALGLVSAMHLLAAHAWFAPAVAWLLLALGMVGSALAPRDLPTRIALMGVCLGGPLVLLVLRPPGWSTYGVPGYWGDLIAPTILACAPLAAVWLAAARDGVASPTPRFDVPQPATPAEAPRPPSAPAP